MKYEDNIQDKEAIKCKIEKYRTMLEAAKNSKSGQTMVPMIELAIEGQEELLTTLDREEELRARKERNRKQEIIVRAANISYKTKDRYCLGSFHPDGDHFIFKLEQTRSWFTHNGFPPRVGYLLIPEESDRKYVITKVDFTAKRPYQALFTAVPADAV